MEDKMTKDLNVDEYLIKTDYPPSKIILFLKEKLGLK